MEFLGKLISKGFYEFYKYEIVPKVVTAVVVGFNLILSIASIIENDIQVSLMWIVITVFFACVFFAIFGMVSSVIQLPFNLKRERYTKMFDSMGFKSLNDEYPILLNEDENEHLRLLTFRSLIPLNEWIKKQNLIETFLNEKISKICNEENDNNIVHIYIVKQELSSAVLWNEKYFAYDNDILSLGISY